MSGRPQIPLLPPIPLCRTGPAVRAAACVLLWAGLYAPSAAGQAWPMGKGEAYVKLSYGSVRAADQFTFDGRRTDFFAGIESDAYQDLSLYLYSEIGLLRNLTLTLSLPYKRTFVQDHAYRFSTFAPGSANVGVRFGLDPLLGIPPGATSLSLNLGATLPTGYTRNYAPSAGPGQIDLHGALAFGLSFWPFAAYTQATAGYRYRTENYTLSRAIPCEVGRDLNCIGDTRPHYGDELTASFEFGFMPFNGSLLLQALANGVWSIESPRVGFTALNPIPEQQRYVKVGGGIGFYPFRLTYLVRLAQIGVSAQYFMTYYGRNTIVSRDLYVGLDVRMRLY